jgi:hypothetical protein
MTGAAAVCERERERARARCGWRGWGAGIVSDALETMQEADCRSGVDGVSQPKQECILKQRSM